MGISRSSAGDWAKYSSSMHSKTIDEVFTSSNMDPDMDPKGVVMREARDSELNPESTPIIIACDVTGSMGITAEQIVKKGFKTLFTEIYDRNPVTDPQIMPMAIGDVNSDRAPLQVGQFEADITAAKWAEKIYLEGNGGGNRFESYDLPYYFAAFHTAHDAFEKRGKKGYIFTMGDETAPKVTQKRELSHFLGVDIQADIPFEDVIQAASKMYHCYHIIIGQGYHARNYKSETKESWRNIMGQNSIWLDDIDSLSETIVSIIQVNEGYDKDEVIASWNGDTSLVVANAVRDLTADGSGTSVDGVTTL